MNLEIKREFFLIFFSLEAAHRGGYYFTCHINPDERKAKHMNTVLRVNDTARVMGVSRATIWNWANPKSRHYRPDFPKPIKISANITGWLSSEIAEYLDKLAAKREE